MTLSCLFGHLLKDVYNIILNKFLRKLVIFKIVDYLIFTQTNVIHFILFYCHLFKDSLDLF